MQVFLENLWPLRLILMLVFLIAASVCDIRTKKIPNRLVIAGFVTGLFWNAYSIKGFIYALIPVLVLFVLAVVILMEAIGAGDIKVLMVMMLYTGWVHTMYTALLAEVMLLCYILVFDKENRKRLLAFLPFIREKLGDDADRQVYYPLCPFLAVSFVIIEGVYLIEKFV